MATRRYRYLSNKFLIDVLESARPQYSVCLTKSLHSTLSALQLVHHGLATHGEASNHVIFIGRRTCVSRHCQLYTFASMIKECRFYLLTDWTLHMKSELCAGQALERCTVSRAASRVRPDLVPQEACCYFSRFLTAVFLQLLYHGSRSMITPSDRN